MGLFAERRVFWRKAANFTFVVGSGTAKKAVKKKFSTFVRIQDLPVDRPSKRAY